MKRIISLALLLAASAFADDQWATPTIDEIRADSSVLEGVRMVSTGQPDQAVLEAAKDAGFVAVIDLRTEGEDRGLDEAAAVEALGMSYLSLPVAWAAGTTFENAAKLDAMLSEIDGPVFLHCQSGNRIGALVALQAGKDGASVDEAIALGKEAGLTRLEGHVRGMLEPADDSN